MLDLLDLFVIRKSSVHVLLKFGNSFGFSGCCPWKIWDFLFGLTPSEDDVYNTDADAHDGEKPFCLVCLDKYHKSQEDQEKASSNDAVEKVEVSPCFATLFMLRLDHH